MVYEVTAHHAKQQLPTLHHPLFDKKNDMAAQLFHEREDLETQEGISLILGIVLTGISFSPPSAENQLPLKDCLDEYMLVPQEIEDELSV